MEQESVRIAFSNEVAFYLVVGFIVVFLGVLLLKKYRISKITYKGFEAHFVPVKVRKSIQKR